MLELTPSRRIAGGRHRCTMPAMRDPCRPEFGTQVAKQTSSTYCYGTRQIWSRLIVVESLHFTEQCAREARWRFKAFSKLERGSMSDWEKAARQRYISQFSRRGPEGQPVRWLSESKSVSCWL